MPMTGLKETVLFQQMTVAGFYEDQTMLHVSLLVPNDAVEQ